MIGNARWGRLTALAVTLALACVIAPASAFATLDFRMMATATPGPMGSLQFRDATHGWATGGIPLYTTDGGRSWAAADNLWSTDYGYNDTMFYDDIHGWAVGNGGQVASSSDGGKTWTERALTGVRVSEETEIASVWFADASHGWMLGSFGIARTTDGGAHWSAQNPSDIGGYDPQAIRFADTVHGCAVNEAGVVLTTTDGGVHWRERDMGASVGAFRNIAFRDSTHVLVGGFELMSLDLANTSRAQVFGPFPVLATAVCFTDSLHGWIADDTRVWTTTNGGISWFEHDPHFGQAITHISFSDSQHGWIAGSAGGMARTDDGGASWTLLGGNGGDVLSHSVFVDATHGWMISGPYTNGGDLLSFVSPGSAAVWGTTDGGQHWERLLGGGSMRHFPFMIFDAVMPWQPWFTDFPVALTFTDRSNGCVACVSNTVYFTADGGHTWTPSHPPSSHAVWGFAAVASTDASHTWLLTPGGGIYATSDRGASWTVQRAGGSASDSNPPEGSLRFADALHGIAVLTSGVKLYTTDGGVHWASGESTGSALLSALSMPDATHAWARDTGGKMFVSSDGGAHWTANGTAGTVVFFDSLHGRVVRHSDVGTETLMCATSDGGASWTTETVRSPLLFGANGLSMPDPIHAFEVGYCGQVARLVTPEPLSNLEPYPVGWTNHPLQLSITPTVGAGGSAVAQTLYRLGEGAMQPYSAPFVVSAEGMTRVEYRSTDASGNAEATETALVRIDSSVPSLTIDVSGSPYLGVGRPHAIATDALSGIDFVEMWTTPSSIVADSDFREWNAGRHTVHARAVDRAGNEVSTSATFIVLPPHKCSLTTPSAKSTISHKKTIVAKGKMKPGHSSAITVRLQRWRKGKWHVLRCVYTRCGLSGAWTARFKLAKGRYRLRAESGRLEVWAPATSRWRTIRVK